MKKKMLSMALVLCMVVSLMPTVRLTARAADADYYVTYDSTNCVYLVGTSTTNTSDIAGTNANCTSLQSALDKSSSDWGTKSGTPIIQLGTADAKLSVNSFVKLISAVYQGNIELTGSGGGYLLEIPSGVTADFEGLIFNAAVTSIYTSDSYIIKMTGGNLKIGSGTTITTTANYSTNIGGYFATIDNVGSGTLTLDGGSIHSSGSNYGNCGIINESTGSLFIKSGLLEINSNSSVDRGVWNTQTGAVDMSGGTVDVTSTGLAYGIDDDKEYSNISHSTINVKGMCAYAVRFDDSKSGDTLSINTVTINKDGYGGAILIYGSGSLNITNTTINVKDSGTISSTSIIESWTTGTVTIDGGTYMANDSGPDITNDNSGFLNCGNGTMNVISGTISAAKAITTHSSGIVNISGGNITGTGTDPSDYAVGFDSDATGAINISGTASITSANKNTVYLPNTSNKYDAHVCIDNKSIYSHDQADVYLTGKGNVINLSNYSQATINAENFNKTKFKSWTSDSNNETDISVLNADSLENLLKDGVATVYLNLSAIPVPVATPTGGSFTDENEDKNFISGTLSWNAPGDTSNIGDYDGYNIYFGSSPSTIYDDSAAISTVNKTQTSYTVADNTELPEGANYFLIYCTNAMGDSKSCLEVPITDVYTHFTVSGSVLKGASPLTNLSGIIVTLYSSGAKTSYKATTDKDGNFQITDAPKGTYTAVVETASGSYTISKSAEFTVSANCTGVDISLANPADEGYPYFVITKGATETEYYYVYEKKTSSGNFEIFDTNANEDEESGQNTAYSSIDGAISEICDVVEDGSATLYFGNRGTNTDNVTDTLDTGGTSVYLGSKGTYTIKGNIEGSANKHGLINLNGASLIVDGAQITSTKKHTIVNEGGGSITVKSGTVMCSPLDTTDASEFAINVTNSSTGNTIITGGSVISKSGCTIKNSGNGSVSISGIDTQVNSSNAPALVCMGNSATISGGTLTSANTITTPTSNTTIPGTVLLTDANNGDAKLDVSGGTILNTTESGYAVYIFNSGDSYISGLYLSGKPKISGGETNIWTNVPIYASDGANASPVSYIGDALTLEYGGAITAKSTVAVSNVTSGTNDGLFSLVNSGYYLKLNTTNLIITNTAANVIFNNNYTGATEPYITTLEGSNSKVTKPTDPTRSGYTFNGWFADEAGSKAFDFSTTISGDKTLYAKWTAVSSSDGYSSSGSTSAIPVGIGGTEQSIGNVSNSTSGGVTTATVTADAGKLNSYISSASSGGSVAFTVPQSSGATVSKVDITLKTVGDMAQKSMTLDIKSGDITYSVPATAVDTVSAAAALGASNLADVTFAVSIAPASTGDEAALTEAASSGGFEVVSRAVTFTVTATYNGKSTEIESFGSFVARTIKLDSSVDPSKITTAITVDADGSVRHIPTYVYKGTDGCYYAVVNSMTNSTYSIIYNVAAFTDARGTWYEAQANEMASRKILTGITEGTFGGDSAITRAEFAAVIVRALGLPQNTAGSFNDVSGGSWYNGYVGAAYKTGIITGRSSTVFDPDANITRQEAMAMIKRAAKLAGYKGTESSVGTYSDMNQVSAWASDAVSFNLANGLIVGSDGQIRPSDTITRAQTATVVLRLLQKAGLVDIRSKL